VGQKVVPIVGYGPLTLVLGNILIFLISRHLTFALFLFLVNTAAQLKDEFWKNR
jgi:hypothetical protein